MFLSLPFVEIKRIISVKMLLASGAIDCIYETTRECGLIEKCVIGTQKVVPVPYGTVMVDLVFLY